MDFNRHSDRLKEAHAFLGASKYSWLNYDEEKLIQTFMNQQAVQKGTELHKLAADMIRLGVKPEKRKKTFNMYVRDAIGFHMTPEVVLMYSDNCFGTADAINFLENKGFLRIHDLKTGSTPAKMEQLRIYAALFCLDYDIRPKDIEMELRIYQSNDYKIETPTAEVILPIMDKIVRFDDIINDLRQED